MPLRHRISVVVLMFLCVLFKGPFATFKLQQDKECDWTSLKFSPDGKLILISTNGQVLRVIDAFQGSPLHTFKVTSCCVVRGLEMILIGFMCTCQCVLVN